MKRLTVSKDVQIILDGKKYLLESNDNVVVLDEIDRMILEALDVELISETKLSTKRVTNVDWYTCDVVVDNELFDRIRKLKNVGVVDEVPDKEISMKRLIIAALKKANIPVKHVPVMVSGTKKHSTKFVVEIGVNRLYDGGTGEIEKALKQYSNKMGKNISIYPVRMARSL